MMTDQKSAPIKVFTDGSCIENPGDYGGWAFCVDPESVPPEDEDLVIECSGSQKGKVMNRMTNNKMELRAVIKAMEYCIKHSIYELIVVSDSKYVVNGINKWMQGWIENGWTTASGKPVKNQKEWLEVLRLKKQFSYIEARWVKGHSNHELNEAADKLALKECWMLYDSVNGEFPLE